MVEHYIDQDNIPYVLASALPNGPEDVVAQYGTTADADEFNDVGQLYTIREGVDFPDDAHTHEIRYLPLYLLYPSSIIFEMCSWHLWSTNLQVRIVYA